MANRLNIKKNDIVKVISGKARDKKGKVLKTIPDKNQIIVEKVNFIKRSQKPTQTQKQGGVIEKEAPINASNVMVVCGKCNQPTRVGRKTLTSGKKVRVCKQCGEILD